MPRQEDFDACARRLRCFDEDKLVFVRQDHALAPEKPRKLSRLFWQLGENKRVGKL